MPVLTKFIIVGVQRSGTTLIRTTIDSHPDILCLGEVFNSASNLWVRKSHGALDDLWKRDELSYRHYVTRSFIKRIGHVAWRRWLVKAYLDWICTQTGITALGFKFMLNHRRGFPGVVPYIREHGFRVIHVVRDNAFDTYLSRLTARARGVPHSSKGTVERVSVVIPIDDLIGELEAIQSDGEEWARIFQTDVPYLRVSYESFVKNREVELERMTSFLGVSQDVELESSLKKLNKGTLSEIVQNFNEVKQRLQGTSFEWCLEGRD